MRGRDSQMTNDWQTEHHISILTKCGIHRDHARKMMALSDAELAKGASTILPATASAMQRGLIAAAQAEIEYRKTGGQ